ncbi:MAG TPA: nuclear transport factor 2 family protein [Solirubrobacteraceae bacterium]|nr:nuclear transport factor 2 family protein [Solirubrobacteraceae bacterium]
MSQQNVEIVMRLNSMFNEGDVDGAFDLVHPDVLFRDLQNAPDLPETVGGRDSVRLVLAEWVSAYDDFTAEALEFVDAGPWVLADVRWRGEGKGSGLRIDVRMVDALRVDDGRVVEWVVGYPDVATALKAVTPSTE